MLVKKIDGMTVNRQTSKIRKGTIFVCIPRIVFTELRIEGSPSISVLWIRKKPRIKKTEGRDEKLIRGVETKYQELNLVGLSNQKLKIKGT